MNGIPAWLADVAADLRDAVEDEFRSEAAATERAVADFRLRHRSLGDVAVELMHRGVTPVATLGDVELRGRLVHVANDLATLVLPDGRRFHLDLGAPVTLRYDAEGTPGYGRGRNPAGCESFLALLRSMEIGERPVELEGPGRVAGLSGVIRAVALDHIVLVAGDVEWIVPLHEIWGVWE